MNIDVHNNEANWINRSKDLIAALEAYDMMRGAQWLYNNTSSGIDHPDMSGMQDDLDEVKYRLQAFARNYYRKAFSRISWPYWKCNNMTLMGGGALGLASVVLNQCRDRRLKPGWHPDRWAQAANFQIAQTLWEGTPFPIMEQRSDPDHIGGYAEGPHYFYYAFENLAPFFIAYANYDRFKLSYDYSYQSLGSNIRVDNYLSDAKFSRLWEWAASITMPNGRFASYDNTYANSGMNYLMGALGESSFEYYEPHSGDENFIGLQVEYLANAHIPILSPSHTTPQRGSLDPNLLYPFSGDIIFRSPFTTPLNNSMFFHLNAKSAIASRGGGHEHGDIGSFILAAGNNVLAIDPTYLGYDNSFLINQGRHHNLVTVDRGNNSDWRYPTPSTCADAYPRFYYPVNSSHMGIGAIMSSTYNDATIIRRSEMYTVDGHTFFIIKDDALSLTSPCKFKWNLNGNGSATDVPSTFDWTSGDKFAKWTNPCHADTGQGSWNLCAIVGTPGGGDYSYAEGSVGDPTGTRHGGKGNEICKNRNNGEYAVHARFELETSSASYYSSFLSLLYPYKCNETIPDITIDDSHSEYVVINLKRSTGTSSTFVNRPANVSKNSHTTISNPFNWAGCSEQMEWEGYDANMFFTQSTEIKSGYCTTHCRFRKASIDSGNFLKYADTVYIEADTFVKSSYEITGKMR